VFAEETRKAAAAARGAEETKKGGIALRAAGRHRMPSKGYYRILAASNYQLD